LIDSQLVNWTAHGLVKSQSSQGESIQLTAGACCILIPVHTPAGARCGRCMVYTDRLAPRWTPC